MTMSADYEPIGTEAAIVAARVRLQDHSRRLDAGERKVAALDEEISAVRSKQAEFVATLREVIDFQKSIKRYAFAVVIGVGGLLGAQIIQLILKGGKP